MYVSVRLDHPIPSDVARRFPTLAYDPAHGVLAGDLRGLQPAAADALLATLAESGLHPQASEPPRGAQCACTACAPRRGLWRSLLAFALARGSASYERSVAPRKQALFENAHGRVLEIGPGAGSNLPYLAARGVQEWIGVEPSGAMHRHVAARLEATGLRGVVVPGIAEALPVPDASVDVVIGTLVLCSVDDVETSLAEVRRVLRPGGRFLFLEHVAAPPDSEQRRRQDRWSRPWRWFADGCHPNRDALRAISHAGFARVVAERFEVGRGLLSPHVSGVAYAS